MFAAEQKGPSRRDDTKPTIYTLEPLRTEGADALEADPAGGISKITLREIEVTWDNSLCEIDIRKAADLFQAVAADDPQHPPIPKTGELTHATFDVQFAGSQPHQVNIRPPKTLTLSDPSDAPLVDRWLVRHGFRAREPLNPEIKKA